MTEVNVQIIVEDDSGFRDAIYLPMSEYRQMSVSQVEALKQERLDNHRAALEAAQNQPEPEPVAGSQQDVVEELRQTLTDALTRLATLSPPAENPAPA